MTHKMSDVYYTISPKYYRGGDYKTGVRIASKERRAMYAELKKHFKRGADTPFKTKQDGLDALAAAGISQEDYEVCETSDISFGW